MNTVEFVDGNAPGISAALLNEPFHLKGASYDEGVIAVTIGPGRANFGGGLSGIVEKLSDSTLTIGTPAANTTYYIFIEPDGAFSYDTSSLPKMGVLIGSVATSDPVTILTRDDLRGILPGPIVLKTNGVQIFTSSGTFTVPEGVTTVYVTMCGGGGGGGGGCISYDSSVFVTKYYSGGSGGNAAIAFMRAVNVTPCQSIIVTIGAGGRGGSAGNYNVSGGSGTAGGTTSFGPYVSCVGGGGGTGASGGSGTNGTSYSINGFFEYQGYRGLGGSGASSGSAGTAGICIVQW